MRMPLLRPSFKLTYFLANYFVFVLQNSQNFLNTNNCLRLDKLVGISDTTYLHWFIYNDEWKLQNRLEPLQPLTLIIKTVYQWNL